MDQPTERCENCFKLFPESKIPTHFGYCRRNIKRCMQCGQMYDINYKQQHEEQFHKKGKCEYCKKEFGVSELSKHKNSCEMKTQFCEYCQLNVPIKQYSAHLKACESRTKQCDKCRKPIPNKEYLVHLTTCPGIIEEPAYNQQIKNVREENKRIVKPNQSQEYKDKYERREVRNEGYNLGYEAGKELGRYKSNEYKPVPNEVKYPPNIQYNRVQPKEPHYANSHMPSSLINQPRQNKETIPQYAQNKHEQEKISLGHKQHLHSQGQLKQKVEPKRQQVRYKIVNEIETRQQHQNIRQNISPSNHDPHLQWRKEYAQGPYPQQTQINRQQINKQPEYARIQQQNNQVPRNEINRMEYKQEPQRKIQQNKQYEFDNRNEKKVQRHTQERYSNEFRNNNNQIKNKVETKNEYRYPENPNEKKYTGHGYIHDPRQDRSQKVTTDKNMSKNKYPQHQPHRGARNQNQFKKPPTQERQQYNYQERYEYNQAPQNFKHQDEATQRAILQSMQQANKKTSSKQSNKLPPELSNPNLLKQSFVRDIDIDEQRRIYEQFEKNAKKR